jgi:hypothetical protein
VEVVSLFFPGLHGKKSNIRLPILAVPKIFFDKTYTYDDIFSVLVWSMEALASGTWPLHRHDQADWLLTDNKRHRKAGQPLGIRGFLCELRGDWSMFASVFRLGHWAKNQDCCWKRTCNKAGLRKFDLSASWRSNRLTHSALLLRYHRKGLTPSPICWMPFFNSNVFKIDWLHTMDLGCAAEWIGNLFNHVLPKLPGNSLTNKCKHLFLLVQDYYNRHPEVPAQYNNLAVTMFRQGKKGFKLQLKLEA